MPVRSKAPPVVAVVLAAGAGSRFRGPGHKLDAAVGGRTLVDRAVGAAVSAGVGPVVVVTAGQLASDIHPSVVHVVNDRWADGQITSLRRGIEAARELGAGAVIVGLGDQPFVTPDAWRPSPPPTPPSRSPPTTAGAATPSSCAPTCGTCCRAMATRAPAP